MLDHIKAHQAEINKRVRSIYGPSHIQYVEKSEVGDELEKGGKSMPIGTISHGYKKIAEGKWKKVVDGTYSTKQEYIDRANEHIATGKAHENDYMRKLYEKDGKKALREAAKADDNDYDDDHIDRHAEEKKKKEDDEKKEKAARAAAASPEENLESLKAALKKRFKDSESEEHHDNVESSLKAYFKSLGIPGVMVDKEPFMEDEMFGGGEHNSVAQTIKHVKNMAQDMLKNKVEKGDNFNYHGAYEHQQLIKAQIANSFK